MCFFIRELLSDLSVGQNSHSTSYSFRGERPIESLEHERLQEEVNALAVRPPLTQVTQFHRRNGPGGGAKVVLGKKS